MQRNELLLIGPEKDQIINLKNDFECNNLTVNIHEAQDLKTAQKVLKKHSPLVVISTDIMLILQLLMKEKELIKETSTKTILFNDRGALPKEVETKLNHCGLSGELTDKSTPKTIYYKATLYLKSLHSNEGEELVYDPSKVKKKVSYVKDVQQNEKGEVQFETETGLVESIVLNEFCDESIRVMSAMESIIEQIEDEEVEFSELKKFSEHIVQIRKTSAVLGLEGISTFCLLVDNIATEVLNFKNVEIRNVVVGVLGDAVSFLQSILEEIRKGDETRLKNIAKEGFVDRLKWLSLKFQTLELEEDKAASRTSIDDILNSLM